MTIAAGNENGPFEYGFRWAWISFSDRVYSANESQRHVEVFVDRKGYLGDATSASKIHFHSIHYYVLSTCILSSYISYISIKSILILITIYN